MNSSYSLVEHFLNYLQAEVSFDVFRSVYTRRKEYEQMQFFQFLYHIINC